MNDPWLFYKGFRKVLRDRLGKDAADGIYEEAEKVYADIVRDQPGLKRHKGAMVLPAAALYRVLLAHGEDAEGLLEQYGESMGKRFARIVHGITCIPGVDRLLWHHIGGIMDKMSGEDLGYRRRLASEPPEMFGVDILSCPYHELAGQIGTEKAVLCICRMDKEYSRGFHHIRYDRNSALPEGAECCEYRLRFDPEKD